jgi:hypothetical protein
MGDHQTTPVFVVFRLIQRLVTSNPSGPYLYRVTQVWRNTNGKLDEVVRAILLDPEARNLSSSELNPEFGKKKEPIGAWIHRYGTYQADPNNTLNDEQDRDLQLVDDLDDLLLAGRLKLLYPIDASDDGTMVTQSGLSHYPGRNPREALLYYLGDTYSSSSSSDSQVWNKVRGALYLMTTSPEFIIQK